jgi:hypothetical protein
MVEGNWSFTKRKSDGDLPFRERIEGLKRAHPWRRVARAYYSIEFFIYIKT